MEGTLARRPGSLPQTQSLYEQQLQMDQIRKIYQKALATPLDGIEALWHEYDAYENGLSKLTAKKVLADRSAAYMSARAAAKELKELVLPLDREEYALPPPADAALGAYKVPLSALPWCLMAGLVLAVAALDRVGKK